MFRSRDFSTETLFIHIADQRTDLVKRKAYHSTPIFLLAFRQEETRVGSAVAFYFCIFTRRGFDSALGPIWSIKVGWVQSDQKLTGSNLIEKSALSETIIVVNMWRTISTKHLPSDSFQLLFNWLDWVPSNTKTFYDILS